MDIEWLEDFLVLSDLSSFTRAAQTRNVTQSAFSRRIRSLEEWIGIPLIDRDTVPPRLTMAGHLFRDAAREMIRQLQEARLALGHRTQAFTGIKFFVSQTLALHFFPEWVSKLNHRIHGLKLDITVGDTYEGMLALSSARCDLLMSYYSPLAPMAIEEKSYPSIYLGTDRLIPVCATTESGEPLFSLTESKSKNLPIIGYPPETFLGRLCNGIIRFSGHRPHFAPVGQSPSTDILRSLALSGAGVAWLPERSVRGDLQNNLLTQAGGDAWCCNLEIRLYASQERTRLLYPSLWEDIKELQETKLMSGC